MALPQQEDAATVLDHFCNEVANLPAEISHLLEEINAKDVQIDDLRNVINSRDRSIQNFVRQNGGHVKNPKEDGLAKGIIANYDRIEALQAEKIALSDKAMVILDRQVRKFDVKLRRLQDQGDFPIDPAMPSLLHNASGTATPTTGGLSSPHNPSAISTAQAGGAPTIANAAVARIAGGGHSSRSSPMGGAQNPLLNQAHLNAAAQRNQRETSADAAKRRRLNASFSGSIPTQSSTLRQSSLGPSGSTPKAGTPVPAGSSSRAGSAQPSRPSTVKKAPSSKKVAPHQVAAAAAASRKRIRTSTSGLKKADRRRNLTSPTPSSSRGSASPTPSSLPQNDGASDARGRRRGGAAAGASGSGLGPGSATATATGPSGPEAEASGPVSNHASDDDDDEADEPEQDAEGDEIYCVCQQVSYGDMVACDNEECPYQWFHWACVGLKAEPKGDWLCPHCRDLPSEKIVKAKD